jgi:hypothetical protein
VDLNALAIALKLVWGQRYLMDWVEFFRPTKGKLFGTIGLFLLGSTTFVISHDICLRLGQLLSMFVMGPAIAIGNAWRPLLNINPYTGQGPTWLLTIIILFITFFYLYLLFCLVELADKKTRPKIKVPLWGVVLAALFLFSAFSPLGMLPVFCERVGSNIGPYTGSTQLLNELYDTPGAIKDTIVNFDLEVEGSQFRADVISRKVLLSAEQICLSAGDFRTMIGMDFSEEPTHIITNDAGVKIVQLVATCNTSREALEAGLKGTIFEKRRWKYDCSICEGQGRCCIIALASTRFIDTD